jgi:hypothetical protein
VHHDLSFKILTVIYRTTSFNIKKFYIVLTLRFSVLYGLLLRKILIVWSRITEMESVYCAVRTESLYKTEKFRL